jgi:MSHA biogenesis protein MshL
MLLSPEGKLNIDRKAGLLQITDYSDRLDKIANYLEVVETRILRQVHIQAKIIEVEMNEQFSSGIDWSAVLRSAGNAVTLTQRLAPTASQSAFTMGVNIKDFKGLLSAFASQGRVNVMASPRVMAMNNEPAVMRVGTQDVYFVTTSQVDSTTGQILQTSVTPQAINEGITLNVISQISDDGIIHLSISPTITERTGMATSRLGDQVPIVSVRETDTVVRVHEGETIVIAGLMQERTFGEKTKVPVLGDMPLIGGLFRRDDRSKKKIDLVILLTPTVVTPGDVAAMSASDQQRLYEEQRAPVRK